jgi:t-SNARE complex subunit (syntaxin)
MNEVSQKDEAALALKARNGRNIALALGLVIFVILVFVVTVVRMGGSVADRPI